MPAEICTGRHPRRRPLHDPRRRRTGGHWPHRFRFAVVVAIIMVGTGSALLLSRLDHGRAAKPSPAGAAVGKPIPPRPDRTSTADVPATLGVDVWWRLTSHYQSSSAIRAESLRVVDYVAGSLRANSIALGFPIYVSSDGSDRVFSTAATPPPRDISILVSVAEAAGLRVELRPLLNVGTRTYKWRGRIHPRNLNAFFRSYFAVLRPYLELAEEQHIGAVVYASEFWSLSVSPRYRSGWEQLLDEMRSVYKGRLEYDSSGAPYLDRANVVPGYDDYTDAYFPVEAGDSASVSQLYDGWQQWFDRVPAPVAANTTIQELGTIAVHDGYLAPERVKGGRVDPKYLYMQNRWFTMACEIVHHFHMRGVYFWNVDFNIDPYAVSPVANGLGPTVWEDRPGAEAVARCFSEWRSSV